MKQVIIYIAHTCSRCNDVKAYFENKDIEFVEKDVQKSQEAKNELLSMGYRNVPIILIGDDEVVGFNKNKLDKLLEVEGD